MPRFVILTHDHPSLHWDFMLESGSVLRTWRLLDAPDSAGTVRAEALADHRLEYLTFEGPVSGGRGSVARWDAGEFLPLNESPDRVEIELAGSRLAGRFVLENLGETAGWSFQSLAQRSS
jgi:hypothetical protein